MTENDLVNLSNDIKSSYFDAIKTLDNARDKDIKNYELYAQNLELLYKEYASRADAQYKEYVEKVIAKVSETEKNYMERHKEAIKSNRLLALSTLVASRQYGSHKEALDALKHIEEIL